MRKSFYSFLLKLKVLREDSKMVHTIMFKVYNIDYEHIWRGTIVSFIYFTKVFHIIFY